MISSSLGWLFVILALSILFHEFCHALAGGACGFVVTSFGIGGGRPLLRLQLPRGGTIFYVCRFGLRFSGVTWVFYPRGMPRRGAELLLACAGSLGNALAALGAGYLLSAVALPAVSFLAVWVPIVVALLVNSVLALLFFLPRQTVSAEQGHLASDGLRTLSLLFPNRFTRSREGYAVASLRNLQQKRPFWESIGDTTMLCVALLRAADALEEIGERDAARAHRQEASHLAVAPSAAAYQRAWGRLLAARLRAVEDDAVVSALHEAETNFRALGSEEGRILVAREQRLHLNRVTAADSDDPLVALQSAASAARHSALVLTLLADRITLQAAQRKGDSDRVEMLVSRYDAARRGGEPSLTDIRVYAAVAETRERNGDDGGAAVAYERAVAAIRRMSVALGFDSALQRRFDARQAPLIAAAVRCFERLGRTADATRCADILKR